MKKIISILSGLVMVALVGVVYQMTRPDYVNLKATWYGGLPGDERKIEGMTVGQIASKADELAAIYAEPVQFRTEDGRTIYQARSRGYDRSKCLTIQESAWQEGKLVIDKANRICSLLKPKSERAPVYSEDIPLTYTRVY